MLPRTLLATALAGVAVAGLADIDHVVLFMQENRAFDHYFGTMAGVRGFHDPNALPNVFKQAVDKSVKPKPPSGVHHVSPFYLGSAGGDWAKRAQCMIAGDNSWQRNHEAWNNGAVDRWALDNTAYSLGYFKRDDIPIQFSLAEEFTVGDSYFESIIGPSDTNRAVWFSGTINSPGSNVGGHPLRNGGPLVEDRRVPGCSKDVHGNPRSCLPMKWKTVPEYLHEQGITWRVYQEWDNMFHDTLDQWKQYESGELQKNGTGHPGLHKFYDDAAAGKLPHVSYIVTPSNVCEHPPNTPHDGGWLQKQIAEAVMNSPKYNSTVLIVSYDETGGWADHVISPLAPKNTAGEWMQDPFNKTAGMQPTGPGFRVPFYIISPWTRRGGVFTEMAAHESQILFLEEWAKARGQGFHVKEVNTWRRKHFSNLLSAFDFANPDYSVPGLPDVEPAHRDPITNSFNGAAHCLTKYLGNVSPPVPYRHQGYGVEKGSKRVRGNLSEGRRLVFKAHGRALSHGKKLTLGDATKFVLHWQGSSPSDINFKIATEDGAYLRRDLSFSNSSDDGVTVLVYDLGNGKGHQIEDEKTHKKLTAGSRVSWSSKGSSFEVYSVTH